MTPPKFCAVCCEPRKGLVPVQQRSKVGRREMRTTWQCVDCTGLGALADLAQHEIRDTAHDYGAFSGRDGNRHKSGRRNG